MSSCFSMNLLWAKQGKQRGSSFYGAFLYSLLRMESFHEIYSACSCLRGRKPAVFHDILIVLF